MSGSDVEEIWNVDYEDGENEEEEAWVFTGDRATLPLMGWSTATIRTEKHKPQLPDKPSGTVLRSWSSACVEAHVFDPIRRVVRRITVREMAAIQGFPKTFFDDISGITTCQKMRAIGNAVPPPLGRVVLGAIHSILGTHLSRHTFIDLCAGTGGMTECLYSLGYSCVAYIDMDPSCGHILRHHYPSRYVFEMDIERFPWAAHVGKIDILAGGPPCQPWSNAGHRRGEDDSREAMGILPRIIHTLRPAVFCFENVHTHTLLQRGTIVDDCTSAGNRPYRASK